MTTTTPKFDAFEDAKKFFYEDKDGEQRMGRLHRATVVVTTAFGEKVAFGKTNKGSTFQDSRGKKIMKKNAWGDVETKIGKLMISADECFNELRRLLCNDSLANDAFRALDV